MDTMKILSPNPINIYPSSSYKFSKLINPYKSSQPTSYRSTFPSNIVLISRKLSSNSNSQRHIIYVRANSHSSRSHYIIYPRISMQSNLQFNTNVGPCFPLNKFKGQNNFPLSKNISALPSSIKGFFSNMLNSSSTGNDKMYHRWHLPQRQGNADMIYDDKKPGGIVVVLLGWLGAQQRHLKRYAEWYTKKGFCAVTFVVDMKDLLGMKAVETVERHIEVLVQELVAWLKEEDDRSMLFHTFSNTGWLSFLLVLAPPRQRGGIKLGTYNHSYKKGKFSSVLGNRYGVILEKFLKMGQSLTRIKGCVVDSAPEPEPNPQVYALGFSAAILKKRNQTSHTPLENSHGDSGRAVANGKLNEQKENTFIEGVLLAALAQFFSVVFKLPHIKQRLSEVTYVLYNNQPPCPQLYIYSDADKIVPAKSVEAFIEGQMKSERLVRVCNMKTSPHVDHFRSFPAIYSLQLHMFLKDCLEGQRPGIAVL